MSLEVFELSVVTVAKTNGKFTIGNAILLSMLVKFSPFYFYFHFPPFIFCLCVYIVTI